MSDGFPASKLEIRRTNWRADRLPFRHEIRADELWSWGADELRVWPEYREAAGGSRSSPWQRRRPGGKEVEPYSSDREEEKEKEGPICLSLGRVGGRKLFVWLLGCGGSLTVNNVKTRDILT